MENQNIIQTIAAILQGIESHLADISTKLDLMHESGKEKVAQKEIYSFSNLGGNIVDYLSTRQQKIHALKALRKLYKLGYSHAMIEQALFSAFRDEFWNDKIRHLKALANTMKNGELVIMNLLKKNQAQTKINAPVHAQFRG